MSPESLALHTRATGSINKEGVIQVFPLPLLNTASLEQEEETAEALISFAVASIEVVIMRRQRKRRNRSIWTREILLNQRKQGAYHNLIVELKDTEGFRQFFRIDREMFAELLSMIALYITYQDTHWREAIKPGERRVITLRYLATVETFQSLHFLYRISAQTIGRIVHETCTATYNVLEERYMKVPQTEEEWLEVADGIGRRWNFPHCLWPWMANILIRSPAHSGSYYFNYKHTFSIVLLAVVDSDYRCIFVAIGCGGQISDGGVFANTILSRCLSDGSLNFPRPSPLPGREIPVPYVIIGDDAFPLKDNKMKPYNRRALTENTQIYKYRHCRDRRISENGFGIFANRWRVFMTPMLVEPEKVENITLCCISLHTYLRPNEASKDVYTPESCFDKENHTDGTVEYGEWRYNGPINGWRGLTEQQAGNRHRNSAKDIRDEFCAYFNSPDG